LGIWSLGFTQRFQLKKQKKNQAECDWLKKKTFENQIKVGFQGNLFVKGCRLNFLQKKRKGNVEVGKMLK
jgi:hypothetical protein